MAFEAYFGALVGMGVTCFKNSLCYLPVYRKPWEHVLSAAAGAYLFTWAAEVEKRLVKDIEDSYDKYSQPQKQ